MHLDTIIPNVLFVQRLLLILHYSWTELWFYQLHECGAELSVYPTNDTLNLFVRIIMSAILAAASRGTQNLHLSFKIKISRKCALKQQDDLNEQARSCLNYKTTRRNILSSAFR